MGKDPQKKKVLNNLQSEDSLLVIETIKELRETGNSNYIPVLIELLHSTDNPEIKQKIIRLLAELKYSDAIPRIVDAIQDKKYASELKELVSVCWENGLDFSQYLSLLSIWLLNLNSWLHSRLLLLSKTWSVKLTIRTKTNRWRK